MPKDNHKRSRGPPAHHPTPKSLTGSAAGDPSPPQPSVAQLQLEAPLTLLKVFMTFSRLKYGLLPRTGRRRRVPANLLIYKSIWQGTINSLPTVGCAERGVSSPWGGQESPHISPALLNPPAFVPSSHVQLHLPPWELSQGSAAQSPTARPPPGYTNSSPSQAQRHNPQTTI